MKSSKLSRLKVAAQNLFLLALLLIIAWYLTTDADLRESIGSLGASILWLVLAILILFVVYRWRQQFQAPRIYPFTNDTGEKDYKDKFDALAHNFSELLQLEIQHINQLLYMPISITSQRIILESSQPPSPIVSVPNSTQRSMTPPGGKTVLSGVYSPLPKLPYAGTSPYINAKADGDMELNETLQGSGPLSFGPISLPLGGLISLILRTLQGRGITGSIQKYGNSLTVIATYESKKWEVSENISDSQQGQVDQSAIRELAHQLAIKMIAEVGEHTSINWRSSKELIDGLERYQRYLRSGSLNRHALSEAQKRFEKAITLDDHFGLAYYYLGLIYDEGNKTESALRMYKKAINVDPELHEAYFRIGEIYAQFSETDAQPNWLVDAIEMGERSVAIAQKSKRPTPVVRTSLGRWLRTVTEVQANQGDLTYALEKCRASIEHLKAADREYKHLANKVQNVVEYSSIYEANLREARIGVLRDLGLAYRYLAAIFSSLDGNKWIAKWRTWSNNRTAERVLHKCLELDANNAETHILLATWYLSDARFNRAIHHLDLARKIKPEDTTLHVGIGGLFLEPAIETVSEAVEAYIQDPAQWRKEKGDQEIHAIYDNFQAAVVYYENVLTLFRRRSEYGEDVSEDTLDALSGLASAYGGLALYKYLYDLAFERPLEFTFYQEDISNSLALLGKTLVLAPFSLSVYGDLSGAYHIQNHILNHWHEYEQEDTESGQTNPKPELASLDEDLSQPEAESGQPSLDEDQVEPEEDDPILRAYARIHGEISVVSGYDPGQEQLDVMMALLAYALSSPEQRQKGELVDLPLDSDQVVSLLEFVDDDPEVQRYLWVTGWMMTYSRDWFETGVRLIERSLQMGPMIEAELASYDLGELYLYNQQFDRAIEQYLKVGTRDPYYWQSRKTIVDILNDLELNPSQVPIELHFDPSGELSDLEMAYEMVLEATEGDPYRLAWAYAGRADLYNRRKQYDLAIWNCDLAINLVPGYTYPYVLLALISMSLFDYDRAIENWERVQELTPYQDLPLYHLGLGDAYYNKALDTSQIETKTDYLRQATVAYRQAITLFSPGDLTDKIATYTILGQALIELGEYAEARLAFQSTLELVQDVPDAYHIHSRLAYAYVKQKQFGLAKSEYMKAIQLCEQYSYNAELAEAANLLAYYIYAERGINLEEGLGWVNRALELLPLTDYSEDYRDELEGAYLDTRGWLSFKQGKYDLARADLEKALSLTMGTIYEHAHLAVVYWHMGEACEAEAERERWRKKAYEQAVLAEDMDKEEVWSKILQLYPELTEIYTKR